MAENETLIYDERSASRWRPIAERLDQGQSANELFPVIEDQFYAAGQKAWAQWKQLGIDPAALFDAAENDPKALKAIIRSAQNDRNAQLVRDVAAANLGADKEQLIRAFVNAVWEGVESQLQLNRREETNSLEHIGNLHQMISRITSALVKNQARFPNRPSRNTPPPDLDSQLNETLL